MFWLKVLSWFSGLDIGGIAKTAVDAYSKHEDTNVKLDEQAKVLVAKQTELDVREAALNQQVVLAEQGNWLTRSIRPLMTLPFVIYTWDVVVYDKVLANWTHHVTDPLDAKMWNVFLAIVIAYFGERGLKSVVRTVKSGFGG